MIDELGYSEYVVVGHSTGGKVAQMLVSRWTEGRGTRRTAPPAPFGVAPEYQEALAHAYDNGETIGHSIDLVLTCGELGSVDDRHARPLGLRQAGHLLAGAVGERTPRKGSRVVGSESAAPANFGLNRGPPERSQSSSTYARVQLGQRPGQEVSR
ncbi:alpha/beta fold hydrolase [Streptomyces sp. NPDC090798]|uniref:alpha/beta fold hydrolase n=1 Tax=Streptomyces sp. NPDC090798 TaxID=3365968 RepID=UPI00382D0684